MTPSKSVPDMMNSGRSDGLKVPFGTNKNNAAKVGTDTRRYASLGTYQFSERVTAF